MGTVAHERVEFLDLLVAAPGDHPTDHPEDDGTDLETGPGTVPRRRWPAFAVAVLAAAATVVAARIAGAPPPPSPAVTTVAAPVFGGEVDLPTGFGAPVQFATAAVAGGDVLWALGANGQVVRVEDGKVTAASAAHGYHVLAARPDGRTVYVTTERFAPTVIALDPVSLEPRGANSLAAAPVTALAAGADGVWAASAGGVQEWTSDLTRPVHTLRVPSGVTAVRTLALVGGRLQALVTTTPGTSALLRLDPATDASRLTSQFTGPVSLVPGIPALVAHVGLRGTAEIAVDPSEPGGRALGRPLSPDSTVWPVVGVRTTRWVVSTRSSANLDCFDATGQLVGRMAVGDTGRGVQGPVATTSRAVYAATVDGRLARGAHASCGVDPHAWPDRPRAD